MTDLKFTSPSGETTIKFEETGRIGTVAPKTQLHIKMDEPVQYETPMTENEEEIEKVKAQIKVLEKKLSFLEELEKTKTPCEEAYKRVYGFYPETYEDSWSAFQDGYIESQKDYKVGEYQETAQERGERVHNEMEETIKIHDGYGVVDYKPTPKTPVEECYKDWWGQYPELETDSQYDVTRWQGFQAGYEFAYAISTAKEVMEKVQEEQKEDIMWKPVALRFGEKLSDVGPDGYYNFTPEEWFDWVVNTYGKGQQIKETVRESVKWCEENPDKDPLDWLKPQTPEQVADGLKEAFREAVKQGVVSSVEKPKDDFMDKMVAELKGQNLTDLIYDWWEDVFTTNSHWDMETSIDNLVDRIELFLPKEQSAAGSQNAYVESAVEGFNDCLNTIKRKLR